MSASDRTALRYAVLIWVTGFVWGSVVFAVPALDDAPGIRGVSANLAISLPILALWIPLTWWLARRWLAGEAARRRASVRLGAWFAGTNFVLDLLLLVLIFGSGLDYFASLTVWLAYALLATIPRLAARRPR